MKKLNPELKQKIVKFLSTAVMISFIVPIVFCIYQIINTSNSINEADIDDRVRNDYVLMLLECLVGLFAMLLPGILTKNFKLEIPGKIYYLYVIFLYSAIFFGEVQDFYYKIPYWDTILHTFSRSNDWFYRFFSY